MDTIAPILQRDTLEYRTALELERWKEEQEHLFDNEVKEINACLVTQVHMFKWKKKKSTNIHVTVISAAEEEGDKLYADSGRRGKEERAGEWSNIQKEGISFMSKLIWSI